MLETEKNCMCLWKVGSDNYDDDDDDRCHETPHRPHQPQIYAKSIFREYSRTLVAEFRYFPWRDMIRVSL